MTLLRLFAAVLLLAVLSPLRGQAQQAQMWCIIPGTAQQYTPCSPSNPLAVEVTANGTVATVTPDGFGRSSIIGTKLFYDAFETSFDTATNWATPVSAGGGVGEAWSAGQITLGTGTTANGYSYVTSQHAFQPVPPGFLQIAKAVKIPATIPANTEAFWGVGTSTATPTAASPITEGCGFEIQAAATSALEKMYAVCFAGSVRTVIQDLSAGTGNSTQPTDGNMHTYYLFFRGDYYYFSIDSLTNIVAIQNTGVNGPNVNTQTLKVQAVAGATAPTSSLTITVGAMWVGDTGRNGTMVCDVNHPYICQTVVASGATGGGAGVAIAPSSSSSIGIPSVVSASAEASHVLKASAGNLYSVYADNFTATAGWLAIINSVSAPTTGSSITPLECVPLPASGSASINYNPGPPSVFPTGITALLTSAANCFTFTSGTITGFIKGSVQ
jgi:hypothetical protein